ncbi:MAG: tetratricopeptide repeat protein [Paracoccaceae bacterium]|nr:tetratricopeptide repeat protein [Paracoccaceae bacterium]
MREAFEQGRLMEAERLAAARLEQLQHCLDALVIKAACRKRQGAFSEAIPFLERAARQSRSDATVLNDLANTYLAVGNIKSALKTYETAIKRFPNDPYAYFNAAVTLRQQGKLQSASEMLKTTLMVQPRFVEALSESGSVAADMGQLDFGLAQCRKALEINPEHSAALTNFAYLSILADDPETAISACKTVIAKDAQNADAINTLGMAYSAQKSFERSIACFRETLRLAPDHPFAANNLGNDLLEKGEVDEALRLYQQATVLRPTYDTAWVNRHNLELQIDGAVSAIPTGAVLMERLSLTPKFQIQQAIAHFLKADDQAVKQALAQFDKADLLGELKAMPAQDAVFCKAYAQYLAKLTNLYRPEVSGAEDPLYHVGESHCLSFAGHKLQIDGAQHIVQPRICFGLKAFHLGAAKTAKYRALVARHLANIPSGARVLLSVGEIDCRWNDGIIKAAEKRKSDLSALTRKTAQDSIAWIAQQNARWHHDLHMINIPAPTFFEELTKEQNQEAALVVRLFNTVLAELASGHGINVIDVYSHTNNGDGFSNSIYHCDYRHLDSRILPEIERQLNTRGCPSPYTVETGGAQNLPA